MADPKKISKETQRMRDAAREARDSFRAIADLMSEQVATSKKSAEVMRNVNSTLKETSSIEEQLTELVRIKQEYIESEIKAGRAINEDLLKRFELAESTLQTQAKGVQNAEKYKELYGDLKSSLMDQLGILSDIVKAGGLIGAGIVILNKLLIPTVSLAKDLYLSMGAAASETARVSKEFAKAAFSVEGLFYGADAIAQSARETADFYGSTNVITSDMLKNITRLAALTGDGAGAVRLNALFDSANGNAELLTDNIRSLARNEGVAANKVFQQLNQQAALLVGKSEREIELLAQQTAEIIKRGQSVDMLVEASDRLLDIEGSLRAEAKARALLGEDINASTVRAAALTYQQTGNVEQLSKALEQSVGSAEKFGQLGPKAQQLYAEAYGLTREQITDVLARQEELSNLTATFGEDGASIVTSLKSLWGQYGGSVQAAIVPLIGVKLQTRAITKAMGKMPKGKDNPLTSAKGGMFSKLNTKGMLRGAASILVLSAALFVAAKAFQQFGDVEWKSVGMGLTGLAGLAGIAMLLGKANKSMIKGALALTILGASIIPLAYALSLMADVKMDNVLAAAAGLGIFSAAVLALGAVMATGVGAIVFGAGVLAITALGGALMVLGNGINSVAGSNANFGGLVSQIKELTEVVPNIDSLSTSLFGLSRSVMSLSGGLALLSPLLPVLDSLNASATVNADEDTGVAKTTRSDNSKGLLEELKGLRSDIQSQPIIIKINDKVVSEISRIQQKQSTSTAVFRG